MDRNKATVEMDELQSLTNIPNINWRETLNILYVTFRDTKYIVVWTCLTAVGYRTDGELQIQVQTERSLRKISETVCCVW